MDSKRYWRSVNDAPSRYFRKVRPLFQLWRVQWEYPRAPFSDGIKTPKGASRRCFARRLFRDVLRSYLKSRKTNLDDSEVRLLASQYGNPDEMLREAWVPALPGINVPGDYMKDYGSDPVSWIKKETIEHPIWID